MTPDLLTAAQVSEVTGRSLRSVQYAAASGALRFTRKLPGRTGTYLFTLADVDAWLDPQDAA